MIRVLRFSTVAALLSTTNCSNGATSATPTVQTVDIAQAAKLQFAIGTATIGSSAGTIVGTNFVATFRGTDGHSAVLANTPTITGPPAFVIGFPGSLNSLTGVRPNVLSNALLATQKGAAYPPSFGAGLGPLVGVFGYGMAADNLLSAQVATRLQTLNSQTGTVCQDLGSVPGINVESSSSISGAGGALVPPTSEAQSNELGLPVGSGLGYSPTPPCPVSALGHGNGGLAIGDLPISYYGGPPAWPSPQGYGNPSFFVGYPLGFTDFEALPVVGKYALDVAYATSQDSSTYGHFHATASLRSTNPLPAISISSATVNSDGTGTVVLTVPPGLFEAVVLVRAPDCDYAERPGAQPDNYAIVTHSTGRQSIIFASQLGPPNDAGQPTQTFCTGSRTSNGGSTTAFAVGFDYPAYESSYPFNLSQTPNITNGDGHTGQADVTTSAAVVFPAGS